MQIDRNVRPEAAEDRYAPARLGMRKDEPIPVEIEQVMAGPRAGPRTAMHHRLTGGGQSSRAAAPHHVLHMPFMAIRVLNGIKYDETAVQNQLGFGVTTGGELIE